MNRRLLAATVVAVTLGVFAAPALAAPGDRNKICVMSATPSAPDQEGYCVTWTDPVQP